MVSVTSKLRLAASRCNLAAVLAFASLAAVNGQDKAPDTLVVTLPTPPPPAPGQAVWDNSSVPEQIGPSNNKGLIWKVSSAKRSVYLLGSIHMASSDMYPMPRHIEEAFRHSDVLVVEVDLNKIDQTKLRPLLMAKGLYPLNDSLWNHISSETKALVKQFCNENGLPSEALARVKPWLATVMASTLPLRATGMTPELGIDQHFLNLARNGMRVDQLETAEWQLRLLADIPENKQEQYLAATLKSSSTGQQLMEQFKSAWRTGDADKVESLVSATWEGGSGLQKRIFGDRNPHMADAAEQCLRNNERCFIVVGAGHLVGHDGIVRLLQNRGFKVEQLFSTN
jgi:uncharacterized protein YbaP (TraB family)